MIPLAAPLTVFADDRSKIEFNRLMLDDGRLKTNTKSIRLLYVVVRFFYIFLIALPARCSYIL